MIKRHIFSYPRIVGVFSCLCISLLTASCTAYRMTNSNVEYITVASMGCIGDGKYDNTKSFKALNNAIAKSTKERIIVEFSAGIYSTFQGLEVYGKKKVCIKGNNATIKKIAPRWSVDNLAIYIVDTKNIEVEDLSIDMRVIDANTPTKEAYRYYAIWCRMDNVPAEKIDIHGCTFIDNLSVPNSMVKPYNGTIWLGSYGTRGCNATISRNIFENSCGRVIYTTNMSNIKIVGNVINLSFASKI